MSHYPVMLPEVLDSLNPVQGGLYVDGTFGAGGYTKAILDAAKCNVVAIDRDPSAVARAAEIQKIYGDAFQFISGCFGDVRALLGCADVSQVDGFVLDIGVSSMQIDDGARGFSFQKDAALDMRMDNTSGQTAADILNTYAEEDIADIIYRYGEERHSRRIARKIVERRAEKKFETTFDLADVVRSCVPRGRDKIDPATRTFQALRIAVNDELGELERALKASLYILKAGGRLVVVTFHSLEDRIVKTFLRDYSGGNARPSRHMPVAIHGRGVEEKPLFDVSQRKAVKPSSAEVQENSRSRSAKLRWAVRTDVSVPEMMGES